MSSVFWRVEWPHDYLMINWKGFGRKRL